MFKIKNIEKFALNMPNDHMFLGLPSNPAKHYIKKSFFEKKKLNLLTNKESNILFLGCMGSGKSISSLITLFFDYIKNHEKTQYLIVDNLKGATDYNPFYFLNNVSTVKSELIKSKEIDLLYNFVKNKNNNDRFVIIIDNINAERNIYEEKNKIKMEYIFNNSAKKNIFIHAISSRIQADTHIYPRNVSKRIHRVSPQESEYMLKSRCAGHIKFNPGQFYTENLNSIKMPYIDSKLIEQYINIKYKHLLNPDKKEERIQNFLTSYISKINKESFIKNCNKEE